MPDIELKQLSLDMGKPEYDMLQGISAVESRGCGQNLGQLRELIPDSVCIP